MEKQYFVYLLASNLIQRVFQHKEGLADGFTKKYDVHQLVYYDVHLDIREAILREKRIKKWNRQWVRHESAPPLVAESATGKARPSAFRTEP